MGDFKALRSKTAMIVCQQDNALKDGGNRGEGWGGQKSYQKSHIFFYWHLTPVLHTSQMLLKTNNHWLVCG